MRLKNEFLVRAPLERTWATLLDIERVAECLPGASVSAGTGDGVFPGTMRIKVGPAVVDYKGTARLVDVDEDDHVATVEARATESRGQGTATATITNRLRREGDATRVTVQTELDVTGRQAQFGRGILENVAEQMLKDFARRLENAISGADPSQQDAPQSRTTDLPPPEPLDLGNVVVRSLGRERLAAVVVVAAVIVVLAWRRRRGGLTLTIRLA
jgi:carbon monoxide dehydrogenase subunit G